MRLIRITTNFSMWKTLTDCEFWDQVYQKVLHFYKTIKIFKSENRLKRGLPLNKIERTIYTSIEIFEVRVCGGNGVGRDFLYCPQVACTDNAIVRLSIKIRQEEVNFKWNCSKEEKTLVCIISCFHNMYSDCILR